MSRSLYDGVNIYGFGMNRRLVECCFWENEMRRSGSSFFSPPSKIDTTDGGALQHRTNGVGRRRKVHGLLPNYDRDAGLASTIRRAGEVLQWR